MFYFHKAKKEEAASKASPNVSLSVVEDYFGSETKVSTPLTLTYFNF